MIGIMVNTIVNGKTGEKKMKELNPRIICKDGFSISVQARESSYCVPRRDNGPHSHYECGFPSAVPTSRVLREYAENSFEDEPDFLETVYPYVPREVVQAELDLHGGIDFGEIPN